MVKVRVLLVDDDALVRAGLRMILSSSEEMEVEELPWGPHEWLCRPGLTDARDLLLVRVRMPPGTGHAFHRHPAMEEIIYVISGRAEQWVEHESRLLGPGDTAHIPKDVVHGTTCATSSRPRVSAFSSFSCFPDEPRKIRGLSIGSSKRPRVDRTRAILLNGLRLGPWDQMRGSVRPRASGTRATAR